MEESPKPARFEHACSKKKEDKIKDKIFADLTTFSKKRRNFLCISLLHNLQTPIELQPEQLIEAVVHLD